MDPIVLSYHNSLLRKSDVALLEEPNWLNDKVIGFYFE
jgi:sentrin-specific protease 8